LNRPRGKLLSLLIASAALAVIGISVFAARDVILTQWYAHRLRSATFVWKSGVQAIEGTLCRIFVFNSSYQGWPGSQAQTILLTDIGGRVITWKEVGGGPRFLLSCELKTIDDGAVHLVITCKERHSTTPGKYTYRLTLRGIEDQR
jgi:hypothetical protein